MTVYRCQACRCLHGWIAHPLLYSANSAATMCAVGVEQAMLWCEVSMRREQHGDLYDRLAHEIAANWREAACPCL